MKKTKILSLLMSAMLALTSVPFMAAPVSAAVTAVGEEKVVITDGSSIDGWSGHTPSVKNLSTGKNTYMHVRITSNGSQGITNNEAPTLPADTYTMTCKVRKAPGVDGKMKVRYRIFNQELTSGYLTEEWTSLTVTKEITADTAFYILIRGANDQFKLSEPYVYPFDVDDVVVKNSAGEVIFEWGATNTSADAWKANGGCPFDVCVDDGSAVSVTGMTTNYTHTYFDFKDNALELYSGVYRLTVKMRRNDTLAANYTFQLKSTDSTIYERIDKDNNVMAARMYAYTGDAQFFGERTMIPLYPVGSPNDQAFTIDDVWKEVSFDIDVPEGEVKTITGISMNGGPNAAYTLGFMIDEMSIQLVESHEVETEIEEAVEGNLIVDGACNEGIPEGMTDANYTLRWNPKGFAIIPARERGDQPTFYTAKLSEPIDTNHAYLFSFRVRTDGTVANKNQVRVYGGATGKAVVPLEGYVSEAQNNWLPITGEWKTFTFRIDADTNSDMFNGDSVGIRFAGPAGPMSELQIDSFQLIDLSAKYGLGYTNLLDGATSAENVAQWKPASTITVDQLNDNGVDVVRVENISVNYMGTTYNPGLTLEPGDYKLSFSLRTAVAGETTVLRAMNSVDNVTVFVNGVNNSWKSVEMAFTVTEPTDLTLFINGGPNALYVQSYDVANVSLICLTPHAEAEGNLIANGAFNSADEAENLAGWSDANGGLTTETVESDNVISIAARDVGYIPATFTTGVKLYARKAYRLTFRIRTADLNESGYIRLYTTIEGEQYPIIINDNPNAVEIHPSLFAVNGEWTTIFVDINSQQNAELLGVENFEIGIYGSPMTPPGFPQLFVDDMVIREVKESSGGIPNLGIVMMLMHKSRAEIGADADIGWEPTNLIEDADTADGIAKWAAADQKVEAKTEGDIEYVTASEIKVNYKGFVYNSGVTLEPGNYKLTLKLRTSNAGEKSQIRVFPRLDNSDLEQKLVDITDRWTEVEVTVIVPAAAQFGLKFCGGPNEKYVQDYDIGDICLVDVNEQAPVSGKPAEKENLAKGAATAEQLDKWTVGNQKLEAKKDSATGAPYLAASGITVNYTGFTYKPGITLEPGVYLVSCDLRAANKGEQTNLRIINFNDGASIFVKAGNAWTTASYTVAITEAKEFTLKVCGGTSPADIQDYDISNVVLNKIG